MERHKFASVINFFYLVLLNIAKASTTMINQKQESKLSFKNKGFVLVCLTVLLLAVALVRIKFPGLRSQLSTTLFIAAFVVLALNVFRRKK